MAEAAGLDPDDLKLSANKLRIKVRAQKLQELADIDEIRHMEEVRAAKLFNDKARSILRVEMGNPAQSHFEGEGQIVAICDTGLDQGSDTNVHPAFRVPF